MEKITSPINPKSSADVISNLLQALLFLGFKIMQSELSRNQFGKSALVAIQRFQKIHLLPIAKEVDKITADKLNEVLEAKGAFMLKEKKPGRVFTKIALKPEIFNLKSTRLTQADKAIATQVDTRLNEYFIDQLTLEAGTMSLPMREALLKAGANFREFEGQEIKELFTENLLPTLSKNLPLAKEATRLLKKIKAIEPERIDSILQKDLTLKEHPAFQKEIRIAKNERLFSLAEIKPKGKTEYTVDLEEADDHTFQQMEEKGIINAKERDNLKFFGELSRLTGSNFALIETLKENKVKSLADLIPLEKVDWLDLINKKAVEIPEELTAEEYAEDLAATIENAFPTQKLFHKIKDAGQKFLGKADSLPLLANTYSNLGFKDIINDTKTSEAAKKEVMQDRLVNFEKFISNNPAMDLTYANLFKDSHDEEGEEKLSWKDIPKEQQPMIRKQLMGIQRVIELGDDAETRQLLLSNGFDSAYSITTQSQSEFINKSGMSKEKATKVYAKATHTATKASHNAAAIRDIFKGGFGQMAVGNVKPKNLYNDLKEIDGFEDLFGSQDYCDCKDCRSIFSPAAYFVDLMYFIESNITEKTFATKPTHPINLKTRRPDLWSLRLTCSNTNDLIPYLDVVNEVLENFLSKVTGKNDFFKAIALSSEKTSFVAPYNLPLEKSRIYLEYFGIELSDIFKLIDRPENASSLEHLKIAAEELNVISKPDTAAAKARFGGHQDITIDHVLQHSDIERKDLDQLLALKCTDILDKLQITKVRSDEEIQNFPEHFTGLTTSHLDFMHRFIRLWKKLPWTIRELDLILRTIHAVDNDTLTHADLGFSTKQKTDFGGVSKGPKIDLQGKTDTPFKEKNHHEIFEIGNKGFKETPSSKDIAKTKLTLAKMSSNVLDQETIVTLSKLFAIAEQLNLKPEELAGIVNIIPVESILDKKPDLFERLFGADFSLNSIDTAIKYHHYSRNANNPADDTIDELTPILLSGLSISETELLMMFELLTKQIPFDQDGDCTLNRRKISLIYRHTRLAKALKLTITDFISLVRLSLPPDTAFISTISEIETFIELRKTVKALPFAIDELMMLVTAQDTATMKFKANKKLLDLWIAKIHEDELLYFKLENINRVEGTEQAEMLQLLNGLTEKELIVQKGEDQYILSPSWLMDQDFSEVFTLINATDKFKLKEAEIKSILNSFHIKNVLLTLISESIDAEIGVSTTIADTIPSKLLEEEYQVLKNVILTENTPDDSFTDKLIDFAKDIERMFLLFTRLKMDTSQIPFIMIHTPLFGMNIPNLISIQVISNLQFYRQHLRAIGDLKQEEIQQFLIAYEAELDDNSIKLLAAVWETEASLLKSLLRKLALPTAPIEALKKLFGGLKICQLLGINGYVLPKFMANTYAEWTEVWNIILGAFRSKFEDDEKRKEKEELYHDKVNVGVRDVLCRYIIAREKELNFSDYNELYSYFLLDVEMGGCFRTSKVVAAISSLQLYVHRCLMNLEQSDSTNNKFSDASVMAAVKGQLWQQVVDEWQWRKNYRVWEANRKVFLYPENYIEPDLRDNKTPLFKELEDELLQDKISKESAEAAYKKYLAQFSELARMQIAGCYYHSAKDTFYLFGRMNTDPLKYYYRKWIDKKEWTAWEKIDVNISAPTVSAFIRKGRLYIFWVEMLIQEKNKVSGGNSDFQEYDYKLTFNYSYLGENNKWNAAQKFDGLFNFEHPETLDEFESPEDAIDDIEAKITDLETQLDEVVKEKEDQREFYEDWGFYMDEEEINAALAPYDLEILRIMSEIATLTFQKAALESSEDFHQNQIENRKQEEENLKQQFETSKGGLKCYARLTDNDRVEIQYTWKPERVHAYEINFYYNRLKKSSFTSQNFIKCIKLLKSGANSMLCTDDSSYNSEAKADIQLESRQGVQVPLTEPFPNAKYHPSITTVNGKAGKYIINLNGPFLITPNLVPGLNAIMIRLTTSLSDQLGEILTNKGIDQFLSLATQSLKEKPLGIQFKNPLQLFAWPDWFNHINFRGAYGEYYRELFFHIPFRIAAHLNANGKFAEAKYWYEKIFNPTANEEENSDNPTDRNWQYIEFKKLSIDSLKEILTDEDAIAKYKKDPFNPHAIARLRLNAYQKSIVMKYIDNLLDWGDHLFTQDTMESINEASMLYILASDMLGKRPEKLGDCETLPDAALTYNELKKGIEDGSEFLIALENWQDSNAKFKKADAWKMGIETTSFHKERKQMKKITVRAAEHRRNENNSGVKEAKEASDKENNKVIKDDNKYVLAETATLKAEKYRPPAIAVIQQSNLAFCVPPNYELHKYWDRVEDRLFKIRNCMNISGVRRSLALFQPPIDPMMLVRAKASGLSLEDVLAMLNAEIPPYRFTYLLDKARQFTATVQGFGNALLSALEKKDVEELTLLRAVHEQNIMKLSRDQKEENIKEAEAQYQSLVEGKKTIQKRVDHYTALIDEGITAWEHLEQEAQLVASAIRLTEGVARTVSSLSYLIPDAGSPFAFNYGGTQIGLSTQAWSDFFRGTAQIADTVSTSASIQAENQRREQEWEKEKVLATQELKEIEQRIIAAEIRKNIAEKDLIVFDAQFEQLEEVHDFYKGKFTNLGLYTFLSSGLSRLYRQAYNMASDMAKLAEKAYRFDLDEQNYFIAGDNWQSDRAGFLAGEKLLLQLQQLEKAYIDKNKRKLEITQNISMAAINPLALFKLKQSGACEFEIPEVAFDLSYPGQYKRIIKSVRISMPCIAGPYTSIGAKLTLLSSKIRKADNIADAASPPTLINIANNTSIATSTAQNDGGMFELNFRDERYLPFEGAGAISNWKLDLPAKVRTFDYDSIADVIFHISYTAADDGAFKDKVEEHIGSAIATFGEGGPTRLFSLRHEFPNAFHQLLYPIDLIPQTSFSVVQNHFPYFLSGSELKVSEVQVFMKIKGTDEVNLTANAFKLNQTAPSGAWSDFPGGFTDGKNMIKNATIPLQQNPLGEWSITMGENTIDLERMEDIIMIVKYELVE